MSIMQSDNAQLDIWWSQIYRFSANSLLQNINSIIASDSPVEKSTQTYI